MAHSDIEIKIIGVTSMTDSSIGIKIGVEKPKIVESLWCNLPDNVLISILERLCYIDQIHFRVVCKSWRLKIYGKVRYTDKFPWILAVEGVSPRFESPEIISISSECRLYDPIHKQKYTIQNQVLVDAHIHASKFGWLLLSKDFFFGSTSTYIFSFYNPFTNETIGLPALKMKISRKIFSDGKATFSTSPTSSDCVICVVSTERFHKKYFEEFCVSTFSPRGGKTWNNVLLGMNGYKCDTLISRVAFMDGVFYFTFEENVNVMGAFKPGLKEWKAYPYPKNVSPSCIDCLSLIESLDDENLLMAHRHFYPDKWDIYRFNKKTGREMDWCKIEKLESRMLFVSETSTSLQCEGMGSLANTIHVADNYPGHDCSVLLSFTLL